ncbi:MAG: hypothetical protein DYH13_03885 [Alphaproteobacteria bacterium PRO2]|nr:hypothetical protein [Alphaproteobacteria bacterium PRO2]
MSDMNLLWDSSVTKEKLEELRKAQGEFTSKLLNESAEFQRKQFSLLSDIVQNQVVFSSHIFSSALNIINDNGIFAEKKAAKSK